MSFILQSTFGAACHSEHNENPYTRRRIPPLGAHPNDMRPLSESPFRSPDTSSNQVRLANPAKKASHSVGRTTAKHPRDGCFTSFSMTAEEVFAMTPRADSRAPANRLSCHPAQRRRPTTPGRQGRERISRRKTVIHALGPPDTSNRAGIDRPSSPSGRPADHPRQRLREKRRSTTRNTRKRRTPPTRSFCRKREYPCAFSRKSPTGRAGT